MLHYTERRPLVKLTLLTGHPSEVYTARLKSVPELDLMMVKEDKKIK